MFPIANIEQAKAWDGSEGDYWTEHAERYEQTTRLHRDRLLRAELLSPEDDVLDVGCGTGALTRSAAQRAAAGSALGIDLSSRMIEHARELTALAGITNARYEQADAEVHALAPSSVDVILSSFGAMFFGDPVAAFANLATALRPGGRMGLLSWARARAQRVDLCDPRRACRRSFAARPPARRTGPVRACRRRSDPCVSGPRRVRGRRVPARRRGRELRR